MTVVAAAVIGSAVVGAAASADASSKASYAGRVQSAAIEADSARAEGVANRQVDLAEKQYADQKALNDKYAPLYEQQVKLSTESQAKQALQSDEQWASYKQFFQPTEQALATKSLNYDTPQKRESAAGDAMTLSRASYDNAATQLDDGLASANVDPSSGAAMAQRRGLASAGAASTAAAGNAARTAVEDKGMAYLDNSARFGRNMPSTGLAAASAAQGSGNSATNTVGQQSNLITAQTQASQGLLAGANSSFGTAGSLRLGLQNSNAAIANQQAAITQSNINNIGKVGLGAYDIYSQNQRAAAVSPSSPLGGP